MGKFLKKSLSFLMICLFFINIFGINISLAEGESLSFSFLSPTNNATKFNPGDNVVFQLGVYNMKNTDAINPFVYFKPNGGLIYSSGTLNSYVQQNRTKTSYPLSGYDGISSYTGIFDGYDLGFSERIGLQNLTYKIPKDFSQKTLSYDLKFGAENFQTLSHDSSRDQVFYVNIVPHIVSYSLSKNALLNNSTDKIDLTVKVLDYNGCSDMQGLLSYVRADLSEIGLLSSENLIYNSCESDGVTSVFKLSGINVSEGFSPGNYSFNLSASDKEGNENASDLNFSSYDLISSGVISINDSTAPEITLNTDLSNNLYGPTNSNIDFGFTSSQSGSYLLNIGGNSICNGGENILTGGVTAFEQVDISLDANSSYFSDGINNLNLCVTNQNGVNSSNIINLNLDLKNPVVTFGAYNSSVGDEDSFFNIKSDENSTYETYINGVNVGVNGSLEKDIETKVIVPNSSYLVNPGDNTLYFKVTDSLGNVGSTSEVNIFVDTIVPPEVSSLSVQDCDYIGNNGTYCENNGNPGYGITGKDFYLTWEPTLEYDYFNGYYIYVLQSGTTLDKKTQTPVKIVKDFYSSGVILDSSITKDSSGLDFVSSGTQNYDIYIISTKTKGPSSDAAQFLSAEITSDDISFPEIQSAAFVDNTTLELTYSKDLNTDLLKYDSSNIYSSSECFYLDTNFGTGAYLVNGKKVQFKINNILDSGKICSDVVINPKLVYDIEGLYNEETLTGYTILDKINPSIIASVSNSFIGGNGNFTLNYTFGENMESSSLNLNFTSQSGSTISYPLFSNSSSGTYNVLLNGGDIGLQEGEEYSFIFSGNDLNGNSGVSNTISNFVYDVTAPLIPNLINLFGNNKITGNNKPTFSRTGSTDNYSNILKYHFQISNIIDFSNIVFEDSELTSNGTTLSDSLIDGIYFYRVKSIDESLNESEFSTQDTFIVDTTPAVFDENNTSILNNEFGFTGYVKNGNHININSILTDTNQSLFELSDITADLSQVGTGTNILSSSYDTLSGSLTFDNILINCSTDGLKQIILKSIDKGGNIGLLNTNLVCDNTGPEFLTGTLLKPISGEYLKGGENYNILWDKNFYNTDLSQIENPINISYSVDDGATYSDIVLDYTNSGSYLWNLPSLNTNSKLKIITKDKLLNQTELTRDFIIDSTSPVILTGSILSFGKNEIIKGGTPYNILWNTGSISDNFSLKDNPITLDYTIDNGSTFVNIGTDLSNSGSYLWNIPLINTTDFKLRLTAFDKAGNFSTFITNGGTIIDSISPSLDITFAGGGAMGGTTPQDLSFINNSGIELSLGSVDNYLDEVFYSFVDVSNGKYFDGTGFTLDSSNWISLCKDSVLIGTDLSCSNIYKDLSYIIEDSKNYQLQFKSIDEAGNETLSSILNYTGDLVNPEVSINGDNNIYFNGILSLSGTSNDLGSGISSVKITITKDGKYFDGIDFVDGVNLLSTSTDDDYKNWSYDFSPSYLDDDGQNYILTAYSYDKSFKINNQFLDSKTLILDKSGPILIGNSIVFDDTKAYTGGTIVNISWDKDNIIDSGVGLNLDSISIGYNIGNGIEFPYTNIDNNGSFSFYLPFADTSSARIFLKSQDKLGNESQYLSTGLFRIDSTIPTIEKIETKSDGISGVGGVIVYFSEEIKNPSTLDVTNIFSSSEGEFSSTYSYSKIDGKTLLELNFINSLPGTDSTPTISYNGGIISDFALNYLQSGSLLSIDNAEPRITKSNIYDIDENGKLDQIWLTFSENMTSTNDTSVFSLENAFDGMYVSSVNVLGKVVMISLGESLIENTNSNGISIYFTPNSNYTDLFGNKAGSNSQALSLGDKAKPILLSAEFSDSNYLVDGLNLKFSETLTGSISGFNISQGVLSLSQNLGDELIFNVSGITGTDPLVNLNYSGSITDLNGNILQNISGLNIKELISPKLLSATTKDLDNNGRIDALLLDFSEDINGDFSDVVFSNTIYNILDNSNFYLFNSHSIVIPLEEKLNIDTKSIFDINIDSNNSILDLNGNLLSSQTISTTDGVGVIIKQARFDETESKIYLNFSENVQSLNSSDFDLNGISGNILSLDYISGTSTGVLTLDSSGIDYNNSEISFKSNTVSDIYGNKFPENYYTKISASVIINEVYSDDNLKYIELKNLSSSNVDISGYTIQNGLGNGSDYIIPAGSNISGDGYYLISNTDSYFSLVVSDRFASLNIENNLYLKNSGVLVDSFLYQSFTGNKSLQRLELCGNGLDSLCWDLSVGSVGFVENTYKGTPKSYNIIDFEIPNISSYTPLNNKIIPVNNSIDFDFNYSDNVGGVGIDLKTAKIIFYKYDGTNFNQLDGVYSTGVINDSSSTFTLNPISNYGRYKAVFSIGDYAGNIKTQSVDFYLDDFNVNISSDNVDFGNIIPGELSYGDIVTITVKTIGAGFDFNHEYFTNNMGDYDGNSGYGACLSDSCTLLENYSSKNIASELKSISSNGELKTYSYKIKYGVLPSYLLGAGNYNVTNNYNFSINY